MNKTAETPLLNQVLQALQGHGLAVEQRKPPAAAKHLRADAWWQVARGPQHLDYVVDAKRTVTPPTIGALTAHLRHMVEAVGQTPLLVAPYITPPVGEKLRALGLQYADAAGNAWLDAPGFLVHVTGRKPQGGLTPTQAARPGQAFTPAGLKIVFALMCDAQLATAPHRAIAAAAGVALGAVPAVLAAMQQMGWLLTAGKGRRLNATRRMLDDWAAAYAHTLRDKTLVGTYHTPHFDTWKDWPLDPEQARWGGEPAAHLLVRYLKPGALTIYAPKLPARLVVAQRLKLAIPQAADKPVELRKPFWGETLRYEGRADTVPPVLVYADLLATGDGRCIETAQMIYDADLARLFPAT